MASIAIIDVLRFAPLQTPATLPKRLALLFVRILEIVTDDSGRS
jgi:hypothetical protein